MIASFPCLALLVSESLRQSRTDLGSTRRDSGREDGARKVTRKGADDDEDRRGGGGGGAGAREGGAKVVDEDEDGDGDGDGEGGGRGGGHAGKKSR